jgi:CubicO group peptidase (beta-lactamase class C family)
MSLSRRGLLGVAAAGTASAAFGAPRPAQSSSLGADIDAAVRTALDAGACPGIAVAIHRRGAPLFVKDYGLANIETGSAVDSHSTFRIGSLTKQFAAAAAVKLASSGQLDLDENCSKYLPAFASAERFTIRELMNHTAGLSDEASPSAPAWTGSPKSSIALAQDIAGQPKLFDFRPGTAWLYSNANYIVLGAVIEQLTGQSLADAMYELVFQPLGLRSLAFDTVSAVVPGRVAGYSPTDEASRFVNAAYIEIADTGAAGAMRGTAMDVVKWHHLLLSGALFDQARVQELLTPGRLRDGRLSGANRFSERDAGYGETQYALGLLVSPPSAVGPVVQHYGYINGFSACLETYTDHGVTMAVLCNGDVGPQMPFRGIRRAVVSDISA